MRIAPSDITMTWYRLCKETVPCHNRDVVLRVSMQTYLEERIHDGSILTWQDIDVSYRPNEYYRLQVTVRFPYGQQIHEFYGIDAVYNVPPKKPKNPLERFNFDD